MNRFNWYEKVNKETERLEQEEHDLNNRKEKRQTRLKPWMEPTPPLNQRDPEEKIGRRLCFLSYHSVVYLQVQWRTDAEFSRLGTPTYYLTKISWKTYVSLQLRVQNWTTKWHFPLNFRTAAYPEFLLKGLSFSCYRMDLSELPNHTDLLVLCIIMSK